MHARTGLDIKIAGAIMTSAIKRLDNEIISLETVGVLKILPGAGF